MNVNIKNLLRELGTKTQSLAGAKKEKEDAAEREARIALYANRAEYNEQAKAAGLPLIDLFTGESRKI